MLEDRIKQLKEIAYAKLNLKESEFCYIGGMTLEYFGIRNANDIDICITPAAYRRLEKSSIIKNIKTSSYGTMRCDIGDKTEITLNNYTIMGINDTDIIQNAQYHININGLKFIRPEFVYTTKLLAKKSDNAKRDINLIDNFFEDKKESFDYDLVKQLYNKAKYKIFRKKLGYIKNFILKYFNKTIIEKYNDDITKSKFIYSVYPTEKFLNRQRDKDETFQAYDVIVRYGFAKEYLEKGLNPDNLWYQMYDKMQRKRGSISSHNYARFIDLIEEYKKNGYDYDSKVTVVKNGYLLDDGSHRTALNLLFNIPLTAIEKSTIKKSTRNYGIDWFKQVGFTEDEINKIEQLKYNIFMEKGIYFPVILWGSVTDFAEEICEKHIKKYGNIINIKKCSFTDYNKYRDTLFDIYSSDDIAGWKIEKKLQYLKPYPQEFTVIYVELSDPKFRKKAMNNHDISTIVEKMKKEIRTIYKDKIDNYFYDIVVHMCDNYAQNRIVNSVLNEVNND